MFEHIFTVKNLIRAAFTALSIATIGAAHAGSVRHVAPHQGFLIIGG